MVRNSVFGVNRPLSKALRNDFQFNPNSVLLLCNFMDSVFSIKIFLASILMVNKMLVIITKHV